MLVMEMLAIVLIIANLIIIAILIENLITSIYTKKTNKYLVKKIREYERKNKGKRYCESEDIEIL